MVLHFTLLILFTLCFTTHAKFTEQLVIEELRAGFLLAQLKAKATTSKCAADAWLLPAALWQITESHGVREVEVSLSRGRSPGELISHDSTFLLQQADLHPAGLIFKAQFEGHVADTKQAFWGLAEGLGALLGVPLARAVEDGVVTAPLVGWFGQRAVVRRQVYVASPSGGCCTGQLAAWASLLPCRREAGLGALLDPLAFAAAPYASLRLRLSMGVGGGGGAGGGGSRELGDRLGCGGSARMDLSLAVLQAAGAEPKESGAQGATKRVEQLLQRLLGRPLPQPCRAAASSTILLPAALLLYPGHSPPSGPTAGGKAAAAKEAALSLECSPSDEAGIPASQGGWVTCSLGPNSKLGEHGSVTSTAAVGSAVAALQKDHHASSSSGAAAAPGERQALLSSAEAGLGHHIQLTAAPGVALQVVRQVVPRGLTGGELLLTIRVSNAALGASSTSGSSNNSSSAPSGGRSSGTASPPAGAEEGSVAPPLPAALLHVFQVVPWQLPIQVHTLLLWVDGQAVRLSKPLVAWHSLLPAGGPSVPGVVELLLRLPEKQGPKGLPAQQQQPPQQQQRQQQEVRVSVVFQKRLLAVFQHAPDASRGVDIPAAEATYIPGTCAPARLRTAPGSKSSTSSVSREAGRGCSSRANSSNRTSSSGPPQFGSCSVGTQQQHRGPGCLVRSAHSATHLVPLPIPDLSMPFNVCCFTSTVLAVYFGGMLNALLRPPAAAGVPGAQAAQGGGWRAKLRRVLLLCLLGGCLALFLDKDLQRRADTFLQWLALGRESHPAGEL